MKRPNFFILGAPKCGTTSFYFWLKTHPNVYLSPLKEPDFFNTDDRTYKVSSLAEYEALFKEATDAHRVVGEGSVWYLFSREAVPRILQYSPNARFLVLIRNPVEMAPSLHWQELYSGNEDVTDFWTAWQLQDKRAQGERIPETCVEPKRLQYGTACKLGEQLERLLDQVDRDHVLVLVLDDIRKDPRKEYLQALEFLNLPDDGRQEFTVYNPAKTFRSQTLRKGIRKAAEKAMWLKQTLHLPWGFGLFGRLKQANTVIRPRPPLEDWVRQELIAYFKEDVLRLGRLLERDFSNWLI